MTLRDLAGRLSCALHGGDADLDVTGAAGLEQARASDLSFLASPKYGHKAKHTRAGAILVARPIEGLVIAQLVSSNPYLDFAKALAIFYQAPRPVDGIHPLASVAASATIGTHASVGPFAVIGENVVLGRNAVIHPHVVIYEGATIGDDFYAHSHAVVREFCRVGHRVILQNGVVVGGDGFGFARRADGTHHKIPQTGVVVIEDDVEIQTLTSVDRATVGETRVRRGAKIDSLVQIGHACEVGEDNIICAQTGLAGSSLLKANVIVAGQVGISGHLTIDDNAIISAQSGVVGDVAAGAHLSGSPAIDAKDWRRAVTVLQKLPEIAKTVRKIEHRLAALEDMAPRSDRSEEPI
jgi:UDP-3-O-[3-hydroxymyristoyl] glucosamine N-acyltransferase